MSFSSSALVLAWIVIGLQTLALGGLLRQVVLLNSVVREAAASQGPGSPTDVPKYLPSGSVLHAELTAHQLLLALFVTPECASCEAMLRDLRDDSLVLPRETPLGELRYVVVSTGECAEAGTEPHSPTCFAWQRGEHGALSVPATPFAMVIDEAGLILNSGIVSRRHPLGAILDDALSGPVRPLPSARTVTSVDSVPVLLDNERLDDDADAL